MLDRWGAGLPRLLRTAAHRARPPQGHAFGNGRRLGDAAAARCLSLDDEGVAKAVVTASLDAERSRSKVLRVGRASDNLRLNHTHA